MIATSGWITQTECSCTSYYVTETLDSTTATSTDYTDDVCPICHGRRDNRKNYYYATITSTQGQGEAEEEPVEPYIQPPLKKKEMKLCVPLYPTRDIMCTTIPKFHRKCYAENIGVKNFKKDFTYR